MLAGGQTTAQSAQSDGEYGAGDVINERYRVTGVLGRGSNGTTYKVMQKRRRKGVFNHCYCLGSTFWYSNLEPCQA